MGESTAISWTKATYNPWQGCSKVSPGCAHCYMFRDKIKYGQDPTVVVRSKPATFNKPLLWEKQAAKDDKRLLVFTCSWSDFFHADADEWREDAWDIIRQTPHLTYQILTKRPERILEHLPADWGGGWPNVWMGTSVENQRWTSRIAHLLRVPAVVHFLSCEPLLGPLELENLRNDPQLDVEWADYYDALRGITYWSDGDYGETITNINWVIVGGESGSGFREMNPDWARSLRDQCEAAGVAFWYKQDSGLRPGMNALLDGIEYHQFPTTA